MSIIDKLFKRSNIKWLIKFHEREIGAYSTVVANNGYKPNDVETAGKLSKPHKEEITRLLQELEKL